jgi:peptidyl-prolyl cis-trans isomerase A (cyclophilin A)
MPGRPILLALLAVSALSACGRTDAPASDAPGTRAAAAADSPAPVRDGTAPIYHPERATEKAPETFKAKFSTTKGDFVVEVTRAWAPLGADRFYNLIKLGWYDGARFYRAVEGFMVQFGINADPSANGAWARARIQDDPVVKSNTRGYVTFAMAGPNSRTNQIFINYIDRNTRLDGMGFAPFGLVVEGMNVVDSLYKGYGELSPGGHGPDPSRVAREGEAYLAKDFPQLDKIKTATLL